MQQSLLETPHAPTFYSVSAPPYGDRLSLKQFELTRGLFLKSSTDTIRFFRNFWKDKEFSQNPHLNRWLLHFTALDYALSIGATECSGFLAEVGAQKKDKFTKCRSGHYAPLIKHESVVSLDA